MGDLLFYRIPQREIVTKNGCFQKADSFAKKNGFVVTDFSKNEKFVFEIGEKVAEISFSKTAPNNSSKETYLSSAKVFLSDLKKQCIDKAIFSRVKKTSTQVSPKELFSKLCEQYPNALVYLISSQHFGTWLGATPEQLLFVENNNANTVALAGTMKSELASSWGEKELEEQLLVTKFIASKLKEANVQNLTQYEREELIAGPVKHLATRFSFSLEKGQEESIANILHPTPAVSGSPQKEAMNLIAKHESHSRSLYAGMIGLISEEETNLYVNLRCAQLIENQAYLYLGGGFTKDSILEDEWQETENKAETLLKVFQNS